MRIYKCDRLMKGEFKSGHAVALEIEIEKPDTVAIGQEDLVRLPCLEEPFLEFPNEGEYLEVA